MGPARIRLATALAGVLAVGGLVVTPSAHAAITGSRITTPANPSPVSVSDVGSRTGSLFHSLISESRSARQCGNV